MKHMSEVDWSRRVRGALIGLAIGEALALADDPGTTRGTLRSGVGTQIAAFTTEGLMLSQLAGSANPESYLWSALQRWGLSQGLGPTASDANSPHLQGPHWLLDVPRLRKRRGTASQLVKDIKAGEPSTLMTGASKRDWGLAVVRSLPMAFTLRHQGWESSHPHYWQPSPDVTTVLGGCLSGLEPADAVRRSPFYGMGAVISAVHESAETSPGDPPELRHVMSWGMEYGAIYVALSFAGPHLAMDALTFAATHARNPSAVAVVGALLGAVHGVDVWPVSVRDRLELTWVLDTVGADLAAVAPPPQIPDWHAAGGTAPAQIQTQNRYGQ